MEPIKPAAGQKSTKQPREKSMLQRKWGSEPSAGTKRSTFADQELKRHSHRDTIVQSSSGSSTGSYSPGKLQMSTAVGQPPQENQYPQHFPSPYSYQMAHPFTQQSIPQRFLHNTKPQRGPDISAWPFASKLQSTASEDLLSVHSRGHGGVFSRRKSPSLAAAYSHYSQAGMEPAEEMHKKEQKPKKPGKYICHYCGRACAKPSVLKKHIRSHTGERPYPCIPCGFSFKTKSNLYKHRKSHAHAIKAGLVPFSDLATSRSDMDQPSSVGEAEVHSDGEQSTDTDEEIALGSEGSVFLDKSSPVPQISLLSDKNPLEKGSDLTGMDPPGDLAITPMKVPILIVPKSGIQPVNECPPFTETETSKSAALAYRVDDSHTIKQRLALRLNEKKGSDSEPMLNLLSPHSKGSTDSGYFSRSESADQQISPPNTNAKSYEEIIFGKYYRLNPRSAVTGMVSQDSSAVDIKEKPGVLPMIASKFGITKIIDEHISQLMTGPEALGDHRKLNTTKMTIFSDSSDSSHLLTSHDSKQYPAGSCQTNTGLLEALPDSGPLIRSNSMPTQSAPSLSVPQGLRGSHSFDERMTSDDVFYPGTTGVSHRTMLRRQAAFELSSAHEGHVDSDSYSSHSKSIARGKLCELGQVMPEGKMLNMDRSLYECEMCETSCRRWEDFENHKRFSCPELRGSFCAFNLNPGVESYSDYVLQTQLLQQRQATETATRKRRKEKSVGDDEDPPSQYGTEVRAPAEMLVSGDYDPKLKGENFEAATSNMTADDVLLVTDSEKMTENRRAAGNVISVIQHTNSLSRPNSFEKSESIELLSYQDKLVSQHSEQSDSETTEDVQTETTPWAESMERQKTEGRQSALPPNHQQYHMPPRLVRQPNIQVPEIRVTEEPDKPEKELEVPAKEPEKPVEEFQWPQRSETLSQLPAEKLPPKKKRLRLAEMEHSSGESSFESTCTSLSRSPSQESNLSHSSSFSMSFDRDENMKSVSPTKQDELGKPSEFLTVPGSAHSLSIPSQHQQREMRRSSSEQAPCPLPIEIPEIRSKSFDYGSLSPASTQADPYVNSVKERKRCFLVRQASLSVYPETAAQEQSPEQAAKQDHVEQLQVGHYPPYNVWHGSSSSGLQSVPFGDSSKCKRSLQYHGVAEEPQQEGHSSVPKVSYNPGQITPDNDGQPHEHSGREVMQYSSFHANSSQSPFPVLPIQQALFWQSHHGSSPRHLQQHLAFQAQHLQKLHIRPPNLSLIHQKGHSSHQLQQIHEQPDAKALESLCDHSFQYVSRASSQNTGHISSQTYTTSGVLLQQVQPVFATQNIGGSQPSLPGMLVPVRIQTHVPSYSSVMYTSVSQIIVSHSQSTSSATVLCKVSDNISQGTFSTSSAMQGIGFNLSHILGHHGGLLRYPLWKVPQPLTSRLESGIPLCLTSGSITVTDASSSIGGSKRMLSPASSLELFMETKQQKRVKEEKMYGQIVEELSAVELSNSGVTKDHSKYQKPEAGRHEGSGALKEGMVSSSSLDFAENKALSPKPVSHSDDSSDNVSLLQKTLVKSSSGRDSPEELEVDEATPETGASPRSFLSASSTQEDLQMQQTSKVPVNMLVHLAANQGGAAVGGTILLTDVADVQQLFQFPSLRTTTSVSWCFLNYTKPNHSQTTPVSSVYASWCISSYNPNPPSLSTKASLALLRSRQRKNTETYTMAAFYRPGSGKLVSSLSWKQKFDQVKPELTQLEVTKFEKKAKPTAAREREKGEHLGEKDISGKPAEPTRIKIFEGGYKSNEDYVYVRGRGRGKYICEECGIRCKKPSMLKKHIRTHTDVRPYVCKFCNFAFKTKGNLTKHMKSKAHMKKCLELGVSVTSVDDVDADEADDTQRESEKVEVSEVITEHQFSDAEDSDGAEEEGDENEDDEEDDEDYEGDSTPKTRSRSTSPQPCRFPSLPVTAASPTQNTSEILGSSSKPSVISYLVTLPSIQITQLMAPSDTREDSQMTEYQRLFQRTFSEPFKHRLDVPTSMDEDYLFSPENSSSSRDLSPSRLSSPGCDSSPYREPSPTLRRYLSPRRDVSPRGHLSPRREASPLRHLSPKRDISFKREVSPRRDFSPRRHLSPVSLAKVVSSGKDISSRREMSPRSRHRGMIRAASPRRGFHHQSSSWPAGPNLSSELVPLGQRLRTQFELDVEQRKDSVPPLCYSPEYLNGHEPAHSSLPTGSHQGYLFSHLPLHSQQQIRAPFPMIPIGGIQMVHSVPASVTGLAHSSRLPLQKSTSEESSTSEVSYPMMDCSMKASDYPASYQEKAASSQITTSRISPSSLSFSQKEKSPKTKEEIAEIMEKEKQEEIIQTCTKAIASLRIAAEDGALSGRDEPAKASDPPQKPLESAPLGIQHFSGPEASHEAACASATQSDSQVDKDNLSVAKTALGHSTFYSRSAEDRLSGQLGSRELPTSTRDPAREVLEKGELH